MLKSLKITSARLDFRTIIQEMIDQARRGPLSTEQHTLKLWAGHVQHVGIPFDLYSSNGKMIVSIFRPTPHAPNHSHGEISVVDVDSITAISVDAASDCAADFMLAENIHKYNFESTPSYIEINNRAALLEIEISSKNPHKRIAVKWSSKKPPIAERFYIHNLILNYEKHFLENIELAYLPIDTFDETIFCFELGVAIDIYESQGILHLKIGDKSKIGHIYSTIGSFFEGRLESRQQA